MRRGFHDTQPADRPNVLCHFGIFVTDFAIGANGQYLANFKTVTFTAIEVSDRLLPINLAAIEVRSADDLSNDLAVRANVTYGDIFDAPMNKDRIGSYGIDDL